MVRRKIQHIFHPASRSTQPKVDEVVCSHCNRIFRPGSLLPCTGWKGPGVRVCESLPSFTPAIDLRKPLSAEEIVKLSKQKLFDDLKRILGSLPTKLSELEVVELARAAWKEAVVDDVISS